MTCLVADAGTRARLAAPPFTLYCTASDVMVARCVAAGGSCQDRATDLGPTVAMVRLRTAAGGSRVLAWIVSLALVAVSFVVTA